MTEPVITAYRDGWRIQCECGRYLPFTTQTECDRCGAWYSVEVTQEAPPIEGYRDGDE